MSSSIKTVSLSPVANGHKHSFGQLVFGLRGCADMEVGGLGDRIDIEKGCVIPSGYMHYYEGKTESDSLLVIDIPESWNDGYGATGLVNKSMAELFEKTLYFEMDKPFRHLVNFCSSELKAHSTSVMYANQLVSLVVRALLLRVFDSSDRPDRPVGKIDIDKLDCFIEKNLSSSLQVSMLADHFFISESQFYKCFLDQFSITPKQYVTAKKMDRAALLLRETSKSVQEISFDFGFQYQSCFTRSYKKYFGMSPKNYRELKSNGVI